MTTKMSLVCNTKILFNNKIRLLTVNNLQIKILKIEKIS